jgi:3-oxoadipate enol-lactonase
MRARVNGIEIEYRWDGPEVSSALSDQSAAVDADTRAASVPVLLSHSLATDLRMWDPQVVGAGGTLSRNYRILRYDTRGHGGSSVPPGPYSVAMLADDVGGLLDALEVERVHFVGLSLGGMIGQEFALRHPDRLVSLVLCGAVAKTPLEAGPVWDERIATARARGMKEHAQPPLARWFTAPFMAANPGVMEWVGGMIMATDPEGYAGCAQAVRAHDCTDRLMGITVPTLVVAGSDDPGVPVEAADALRQAIPGARLAVIERASHLMNVEQPEQFTRVLSAFLDAQRLPGRHRV